MTTKKILNLKARPEQKIVLKKVVLLYTIPGRDELQHQWIEIDEQHIVPNTLHKVEFTFDSFTAHHG